MLPLHHGGLRRDLPHHAQFCHARPGRSACPAPVVTSAEPVRNASVIAVRQRGRMTIRIDRVRSSTPELEAFIAAHLRDMEPTAPPASRHAQGTARLLAPDARLFVAFDDALVGTGALVPVEPEHEELKSMRTAPSRRGRGIGAAMLDALLGDARSRGIRRVSLETGAADFFWPAHRLYAKAGFDECEPFGSYAEDPHSLFLTLRLS